MPKKREGRIYWRARGGARRAYGDFRDLGGRLEALRPTGEKLATTDPDVAAELVTARVRELEARRRSRVILGVEKEATLEAFAACPRPFTVAAIDPKTMQVEVVATGPADPKFSNITMALRVGEELWVGSFAADRIAYRAMKAAGR